MPISITMPDSEHNRKWRKVTHFRKKQQQRSHRIKCIHSRERKMMTHHNHFQDMKTRGCISATFGFPPPSSLQCCETRYLLCIQWVVNVPLHWTVFLPSPIPHSQISSQSDSTVIGARMSHWKWRETKQHPSRARSGHKISCSLVSLHFRCDILAPIPVHVGTSKNKSIKGGHIGQMMVPSCHTLSHLLPIFQKQENG